MYKNVLISTIQPVGGGVPSMLRFVIDTLRHQGHQISLAYYEPFSVNPALSVPVYHLPLFKTIGTNSADEFYGCAGHGVGCWLPELEFTHYWATKPWRSLISRHDAHIVVSGSCLAALPFLQTSTPFIAWVATDWMGDRKHRVGEFPWFRRTLDHYLVRPILSRLEKKIIASGKVIALSKHTQTMLNNLLDEPAVTKVLTMPIDLDLFAPKGSDQGQLRAMDKNPLRAVDDSQLRAVDDSQLRAVDDSQLRAVDRLVTKIGFVSRFEDPRKNLRLLFEAMSVLLKQKPELELVLIGDTLSEGNKRHAKTLGIWPNLVVHEYVARESLPEQLRQLDVFVLPSHQEGLCIAALEAMSCGVPVVSTRCGGPESYIVSGQNGLLCDSTPDSMSAAILQLLSNESERLRYANAARHTVFDRFNPNSQSRALVTIFDQQFK